MKEGRRGLGIGEESHDEACPSEIANALPGIRICFLVIGTGRGLYWLVAMRTPGVFVVFLLIGGAAVCWWGWLWAMVAGVVIGKRNKAGVLGGVACAGGVGGVFR